MEIIFNSNVLHTIHVLANTLLILNIKGPPSTDRLFDECLLLLWKFANAYHSDLTG